MTNDNLKLPEVNELKSNNTSIKSTLEVIKGKMNQIKKLKEELLAIEDELMHFDIIDMITQEIVEDSSIDQLISLNKSIQNCKIYFSQSNINLEYLEKSRRIEKLIKLSSYNKLMEEMEKGEGFVKNKSIKELLNANEDVKNIFKKQFILKRQKEFYRKMMLIKDTNTIYFLIQHELNLKEMLFDDEDDSFLYDILVLYYDKLSKEDIVTLSNIKSDDKSKCVFNKYLRIYFEEKYGRNENIFDL